MIANMRSIILAESLAGKKEHVPVWLSTIVWSKVNILWSLSAGDISRSSGYSKEMF
jgi:hypothetical protein